MLEDEVLKILSHTPLFKELPNEDLKVLLENCEIETYERGTVIIHEGQEDAALYVVINGNLEVFLPEKVKGKKRISRVVLNTLGSGDCFGEYSLIDKAPVSASVAPIKPSLLLKIPRSSFEEMVNSSDRIGRFVYKNLLNMLVKRIREKDKELDIFTSY